MLPGKFITIFRLLILMICMGTACGAFAAQPDSPAAPQNLTLGVLADRPEAEMRVKYEPLAEYLTNALPGYQVNLRLLSYDDIEQGVTLKSLDMVLTNPVHYIQIKNQCRLSAAIATMVGHDGGMPLSQSGGVIFTRADRKDLTTLADLSGKRIAIASRTSLGGYLAPLRELLSAGITEPDESHLMVTGMPHDRVVTAVLAGQTDVGFVRTDVLEEMAHSKRLDLKQIAVINTRNAPGFPHQLSTTLYPEWPFIVLPHVPERLARKVAVALLSLKTDTWGKQAAYIHDFTVPADYESVETVMRDLHQPPFSGLTHYTLKHVWDNHSPVIVSISVLLVICLFLGIFLVATNRKLIMARQAAQEVSANLHSLVDNFPFPIWFKDTAGRYLAVNRSLANSAQCVRPELLIGKTDLDFWPPDLAEGYLADDRDVMETRCAKSVNELFEEHGKRHWIETFKAPVMDANGHLNGTVGFSRDITEQKQLQDQLRTQQDMYADIFDHIGVGISVIAPDMRIMFLNQVMKGWFGCVEAAKGHVCYKSYNNPPLGSPCPWCPTVKTLADGQVHEAITETPSPEGIRNFKIITTPILDNEGTVLSVVEVVEDITEHINYEKGLMTAKLLAESASRAKSDFLANMSHEIRTPMNGILGMLQLMGITGLDDEQEEYLHLMDTSARNLLDIINDILDLSKIEAGKVVLEQIAFSLPKAIRDIVTTQISLINGKELTLDIITGDGVPETVVGDPLRLKQIILNLLGNAIKFTSQGGITIRTELARQSLDSTTVRISIIDSGIGIDPEHLEKIFIPFEQADTSTTRQFGGTGLGLTICRQLVELMAGTIAVESAPGEGSCFHITIPFGIDNTAGSEEASMNYSKLWDGPKLSILVAEDQEINLKYIRTILEKMGHRVVSAENGAAAVASWQEDNFDCILMDVQMPVMGGKEAVSRIRLEEQNKEKRTPIIALTAHALKGDKEELLALGFDNYLAKPLMIAELANQLKNLG